MEFNKKLENIDFSGISKIVRKANSVGGDLIRLEIGDVEFNPPTSILDGIFLAFEENRTHYPAFQGDNILIQNIVKWLSQYNNISVLPEQILITAGGSMALYLSLQSILNNGDEVLLPIPVWPHLHDMILLTGAVPILVPLLPETGFHLDFDLLRNNITSRTKAILINSPNNPTGTIYSKSEIQQLSNIAGEHNLTIICDEEYEAFCYNEVSIYSPIQFYNKSIICRSFSKIFSISGLRLGFIIAPSDWIPIISKWNLYSSMYNSSIVQRAVSNALVESRPFVEELVTTYKKRMLFVSSSLNKIPGIRCNSSEGAIYVWPDFREITYDDIKLADYLLEKEGVVTVPGSVFGQNGKGFLRISLACSDTEIERALIKIKNAVNHLIKFGIK
jgi:aminotransferase